MSGTTLLTPDDLKRSLIRLDSWPDLSFVPEASQVRVARICGLLSRKPTVGHLIPRVLGESDESVLAEVLKLVGTGHVHVVGAGTVSAEGGSPSAFASLGMGAGDSAQVPAPPKRSLISKLWAKLGL